MLGTSLNERATNSSNDQKRSLAGKGNSLHVVRHKGVERGPEEGEHPEKKVGHSEKSQSYKKEWRRLAVG